MAKATYKGDANAAPPAGNRELAKCRKWKRELALAEKRERDWCKEGEKTLKRYRGEEKTRSKYNVLWSNTETLRPAIYNSKPVPDVRRRFSDADPIGKAVAEVLDRSLTFSLDGDDANECLENDVLDALIVGRGLSRVIYVPSLAPAGSTDPKPAPADTATSDTKREGDTDAEVGGSMPSEPGEGSYEQVTYEQVIYQHVDWKDFRHGYGRTWPEVPWCGFRHDLIEPDAKKKFGAAAIAMIEFAAKAVEDKTENPHQGASGAKVAEFWEIWHKESERVFFLQEQSQSCLYPIDNPEGEPPLKLEGFFPVPKPLMLIENTSSLLPIRPFSLYESEANELDKLSARINKIVGALRLRGVYDSKLAEIPDLLTGEDNQLTPVQNAQVWADAGGLEKAIAWMPIEQAASVLTNLYDARTRQKIILDELTGISDIVRGVSDPDETLGAQKLKSGFFSVRLWRMQNEVKRYARDLMRLAAQVMAGQFGADTFAAMTDLKFPTAEQKAVLGQQAAAAQQAGQPPPFDPALLQLPTWDDVLNLMHSPALRQFRIDVETDSTISGTIESDMEGLAEVLTAISKTLEGFAPLVQSGALPIDAAKSVVMTVIRRARMGSVVEDAFDKMKAPNPPQQPPDSSVQVQQIREQGANQRAQQEAAAEQQRQAAEAANERQLEAIRQQGENQRLVMEQHMKTQREQLLEANKTQREEMTQKFDAFVKIIVATISATKQPDSAVQPKADALVAGTSKADVDPSTTLANPDGAAQ